MSQITLSTLAGKPDEFFEINDDEKAKRLLLELGIISRFNKNPPSDKPTTQFVAYNENPTHHILALLYLGCEEQRGNGYLVHCLPKSRVSQKEFIAFIEKLTGVTQAPI